MNQPTDVLSFPLRSHREFRRGKRDPDGVFRLGDIVIAIDMVKRQARENGVPLPRELSDLFAHGLLHIAGHHHDTRAEARRTAALAEKLVEGRFDR